jgi:hypothetical protein
MQLLSASQHWFADGTFRTVPLLFHQLYTLHGLKENTSVPLLFALLPDKSQETYITLLQQIKVLEPSVNPLTITLDFEKSMIGACSEVFPTTTQTGCFFHFMQCIFRSIQRNGLKQLYETDIDFAFNIRLLPAIAFVPLDSVVDAFEIVLDSNIISDVAQKWLIILKIPGLAGQLEEMLAGHHNSLTNYGIVMTLFYKGCQKLTTRWKHGIEVSSHKLLVIIQIFGNS